MPRWLLKRYSKKKCRGILKRKPAGVPNGVEKFFEGGFGDTLQKTPCGETQPKTIELGLGLWVVEVVFVLCLSKSSSSKS